MNAVEMFLWKTRIYEAILFRSNRSLRVYQKFIISENKIEHNGINTRVKFEIIWVTRKSGNRYKLVSTTYENMQVHVKVVNYGSQTIELGNSNVYRNQGWRIWGIIDLHMQCIWIIFNQQDVLRDSLRYNGTDVKYWEIAVAYLIRYRGEEQTYFVHEGNYLKWKKDSGKVIMFSV